MSAGGHKWLLSDLGIGIFYCRKDVIEELTPALTGWRSHAGGSCLPEGAPEYPPYQAPLWADARRFDEAHPNWLGLFGLGVNLKLFVDLGPEWIEQRIRGLTDLLIEGLSARGYRLVSPVASWSERSGIVTFDHEIHSRALVHQRLRDAGVIVGKSQSAKARQPYHPGLRSGIHFYNTEDEIGRLLEALP